MNRKIRSVVEKYCPVVGRNVAVETTQGDENSSCLNKHVCDSERGGCTNKLFCERKQ